MNALLSRDSSVDKTMRIHSYDHGTYQRDTPAVEDEEAPSLTPSIQDSSESALEDDVSSVSSCALLSVDTPRRSVSFNDIVQIREHALTIGDHPFCFDGLPLTLDWEHSEASRSLQQQSKARTEKYRPPPRLSYDQRRNRLFAVSSSERVKSEEIDMLVKMLQQSWSEPKLLPPPIIEDVEEFENDLSIQTEEEEEEEETPPELTIRWKRVPYKRSHAFCE